MYNSWCSTPWQVGTVTAVDGTETTPAFQEPPRTFFSKNSNYFSHSSHSTRWGQTKQSIWWKSDYAKTQNYHKEQSNLPPPLTIKQSNVNTQDLTHRCTGCAVWVFFPPQPGTHTTKSDLQILPHPLCATPSKSPSLTASELHCRIAHCHLHHHHHHPKLSHNTPPPDLNPQSEPEANIQALGFSKYVTILEIANQGDSLDSILPGMETEWAERSFPDYTLVAVFHVFGSVYLQKKDENKWCLQYEVLRCVNWRIFSFHSLGKSEVSPLLASEIRVSF